MSSEGNGRPRRGASTASSPNSNRVPDTPEHVGVASPGTGARGVGSLPKHSARISAARARNAHFVPPSRVYSWSRMHHWRIVSFHTPWFLCTFSPPQPLLLPLLCPPVQCRAARAAASAVRRCRAAAHRPDPSHRLVCLARQLEPHHRRLWRAARVRAAGPSVKARPSSRGNRRRLRGPCAHSREVSGPKAWPSPARFRPRPW